MYKYFRQNLQIGIIGILFISIFLVTFLQNTDSQDQSKTFNIDTVHSSVVFRAKHMSVAYFYGRFNDFSGNITLNETDISKSKVEFKIKVSSIDTANEKRDQHLSSPDFFNVKQFPVITFKSAKVSKKEGQENVLVVTGDLDLHGVKKSITVDVEITGNKIIPQSGEIIGFHTTFDIMRSDYGFTFGMEGVDDQIKIIVSIEAGKK